MRDPLPLFLTQTPWETNLPVVINASDIKDIHSVALIRVLKVVSALPLAPQPAACSALA